MMKSYKISDGKQRQTNLNDEKLHKSMKNEGKRNKIESDYNFSW